MITQERLKQLVAYDSVTGRFTRLVSRKGNEQAGSKAPDGYVYVYLDGRRYLAHRLAWLYIHGSFPNGQTDHINRVRDDNRIENLRDATVSENQQNVVRAKRGRKSGSLLGASFCKWSGRWQAHIQINKKQKNLGRFATEQAAHAAYLAAKRELHPFGEIAK